MIATKTVVPGRKLKIKFTSKRIDADVGQQISLSNDCSMEKNSQPGTKKRGPVWTVEIVAQKEKRQKIDRSVAAQCLTILNKLMTHKVGWVFNQAVDPVALNIPDYFTIISNPMDLGTIKSKLQKNAYSCAEEFAADVRLTFSNAMLYNPPANDVHKMAEDLNHIFEKRWKLLEEKCKSEGPKLGSGKSPSGSIKQAIDTPKKYEKTASFGTRSLAKRPTPTKEKVGSCSSETSAAEEIDNSTRATDHIQKLVKSLKRGTEHSSTQACSATKGPATPVLRNCGSCGHTACRCSRSSDTAHVSSSDISSDRSLERDYHISSVDSRAKRLSTSPMRKSDHDSDAVSAVDDEKPCSQATTLVSDAASREDESTPLDVPLSPQKALRAAMLKYRFADTILKAQQKTLSQGDNDSEKLKKERERLERRQRQEKARIEAEIRAAEAASREKAEIESKQQRQREREAARVALEKMVKTAEIEQNLETLEELEILSGYTPSSRLVNRNNGRGVLMASSWPIHIRSPLEELGLFIKAEYLELKDDNDEDEAILSGDGEEGEIFDELNTSHVFVSSS